MSASRVVRHLVDPVIEVIRPLPPLAFGARGCAGHDLVKKLSYMANNT
jgi:hypothetical protein